MRGLPASRSDILIATDFLGMLQVRVRPLSCRA